MIAKNTLHLYAKTGEFLQRTLFIFIKQYRLAADLWFTSLPYYTILCSLYYLLLIIRSPNLEMFQSVDFIQSINSDSELLSRAYFYTSSYMVIYWRR